MTVVSLILVSGGILGTVYARQPWLMALVFLGLFGPFLVREIGLRSWRDDFQREAVMRSGMHALMAVGALLTLSAILEGGGTDLGYQPRGGWDRIPAGIVLMVMGITWGLSWLLQFWGVRTGAFRILVWTMATVTAILVIVLVQQLITGHAVNWQATAEPFLYLLPGWALVLASRRWPRITGALLVGIVAWQFRLIGQIGIENEHVGHQVAFFGVVVVVLPFLVPAVALLLSRRPADLEQDSA